MSNDNAKLTSRINEIDQHIGQRVRLGRELRGFTDAQFAERLGLQMDQLCKFEVGAHRISASRLYEISSVLELPSSWFFEGLASEQIGVNDQNQRNSEMQEVLELLSAITDRQRRAELIVGLKKMINNKRDADCG